MNQGWLYQEQVAAADGGLTLLAYYADRYRHSSREEWQIRIAGGQVLVDGNQAATDTLLQVGQRLTYHRSPWEELEVPLSFEVLHEDADLLVVAKPAGLPVLPGGGFLEHTLLRQLQRSYPQETPLPIHRLGRGTSGLMLLARSPLARADLSRQMRDRQIHKTYRALVGSGDIPEYFAVTDAIGKISHPNLGYIYSVTADGLAAYSQCRVLKRHPETTLLEIVILTGRPHQIRIHLAAAGYPLIGDPLYTIGGVPRQFPATLEAKLPVPGDCGYHLHAYQLSFTHPVTKQSMRILCPPPAELI